jgi:ribonuclease R
MIAKQSSTCEQAATEAERENDRWKTVLIMKSRIGQRFEGVVQGFSPKVMFVKLSRPFVEVGVPLGALGGAFEVDQHRTKAFGMKGQVVIAIGDAVKVEVTGVDEDLRRVSAWVVEAQGTDAKGKRTAFIPSLAAPATLREADFVKEQPRGRYEAKGAAERPRRDGRPSGRPPKPARTGGGASGRSGPGRPSQGKPTAPHRGSKPTGPDRKKR